MKFERTALPGVLKVTPSNHADDRGFLRETWHAGKFADFDLNLHFVQTNHSRSKTGVLRGLHFQKRNPQAKLVSITRGRVFDVAVDIRPDSPTFKKWVGVELSGDDATMLYIPVGYAHGFYVIEGPADLIYQCTALYESGDDQTLAWNDPDIAIKWPLSDRPPTLSLKDGAAPSIANFYTEC